MKPHDTDIFYIPCAYLHRVRLDSSLGRILSWWFLLIVPTMGYYLLLLPTLSLAAVSSYVILLAAVVPYYELGYMYNDTHTTRREAKPTLRLSHHLSTYFYQHAGIIVGIRMVWVLALLSLFGQLNAWDPISLLTIMAALALQVIFALYDSVRGFATTIIYPILVSWRYLVFLLPCWGSEHFGLGVLLCLLSYPLEISIERFSMPNRRYGFMARILPTEESKTRFRATYYAILVLLLIPIWMGKPLFGAPILMLGIYRWIRLYINLRK